MELPTQIYFRDGHPAAVAGVNVIGINIPVKIGEAIVMAGDVVLGGRTGIMFIPPQLVKEIVDKAELTHIHDEWTKKNFSPRSTRRANCTAARCRDCQSHFCWTAMAAC